ncbi:hypothetical protein D047_1364B, partial [Vibrio parahaemolyticus VPTS-2010_2]
KMWKKCEFV